MISAGKRTFIISVFAAAIGLSFGAEPARASWFFNCRHVLSVDAATIEQSITGQKTRDLVSSLLMQNRDIPAFHKKTPAGNLPVILLTMDTYPQLQPLLDLSMGTLFSQQVGYRNDHGLLRVSSFLIDVDAPGRRAHGEIHDTGLSWRHMKNYMGVRSGRYNMIEVGFLLSKTEVESSLYYQKVRRASIIRVPFTFGGAHVDLNQPNMLRSGEHCFIFCKGSAISSHIGEIRNQMNRMGIKDVDAFMAHPETRSFLSVARTRILSARFGDPYELHWGMVNQGPVTEALATILPKNLSPTEKASLINWIIGLDASLAYESVRNNLGLTGDGGLGDMRSPRASFILVYGKETDALSFREATFNSPGVMYSWTSENQTPLPQR